MNAYITRVVSHDHDVHATCSCGWRVQAQDWPTNAAKRREMSIALTQHASTHRPIPPAMQYEVQT